MSGDKGMVSNSNLPPEQGAGGHWSLFILAVAVLAFLGWGFVYAYSYPSPTWFQTTVFFALLGLILFETKCAVFYRNPDS